jgi:cytochrome c-type biogenesis protein CcmH
MLGVSLVAEAGGQETPGAVTAFRQALKLDPHAVLARFHLARAQAQGGDRTGAVAALKALQADMPIEDPRRASLAQAITEAEGPAPSAAAAAVAGAAPGDRIQMIRGMVANLAAKLKADPDNPEGWVRLVRSYAVLGDAAARDAALTEAKARYRGRADVLQQLDAAAKTEPMT